jgi:hypothetical protein
MNATRVRFTVLPEVDLVAKTPTEATPTSCKTPTKLAKLSAFLCIDMHTFPAYYQVNDCGRG